MTNLERAKHIHELMDKGKLLEAFDTYYHDEVVKIEGNGQKVEGKEANRKTQEEWLNSVEEWIDSGVHAIAEDPENGKVLAETWARVKFKEYGEMAIEQCYVQTWEDGQIKHIRFYYNAPDM